MSFAVHARRVRDPGRGSAISLYAPFGSRETSGTTRTPSYGPWTRWS
ncbi:hypothetical protein [Streptomyces sp. NPDC006463]